MFKQEQTTILLAQLDALFSSVPKITVAEWVQQNVRFNESGGNTQTYSLAGREFFIEPLNLLANNKIRNIVLVCGAQMGKTSMIMAGLLWRLSHFSTTCVWAMPGQQLAETFATNRWIPMIKASSTKDLYKDSKKQKKNEQHIGASTVFFRGSNSNQQSSSIPAQMVIMDETDKFSHGTKGEANAVSLFRDRTLAQNNYKIICTSTPTLEDGLIWNEYVQGDQRQYFVPCPNCEKDVIFAWSKDFYTLAKTGKEAYIFWDKDAKVGGSWDYNQVRKSAYALCPHCGFHILDAHKSKMIRNGHWEKTNNNSDESFASFHINALYGCSVSGRFGNMAVEFLKATKSLSNSLQNFVNSYLGEPWRNQEGMDRVELLIANDAKWTDSETTRKFLTVDYQQTTPRLFWVVREWSPTGDSKLIDFGSIEQDDFTELERIQDKYSITNENVVIDSGFEGTTVYAECVKRCRFIRSPQLRTPQAIGWIPSKGFGKSQYFVHKKDQRKYIYRFSQASSAGLSYRLDVLEYNDSEYLDILYRLRHHKADKRWAVTNIANEKYWSHMDSMIKRKRETNGMASYQWELRNKGTPNHWLDCEKMQLVLASVLGYLDASINGLEHTWKISKQETMNPI